MRRWRRQDSRHETVKVINRVVNDAIAISKKDETIKPYIDKAIPGVMNLKETYSMCHQTCARLDMILDKMKPFKIETPFVDVPLDETY